MHHIRAAVYVVTLLPGVAFEVARDLRAHFRKH